MSKLNTAFLALGSNLDNPQQQIKTAIQHLQQESSITIEKISSFYQTPPLGPPQDDYINAVIEITTSFSPLELLENCLAIEKKQGRIRNDRWGPRCIDIDILLYGQVICKEDNCTIPHPGIAQRLFVLVPLVEIAPELQLPDGQSVATLLQQFKQEEIETIQKVS